MKKYTIGRSLKADIVMPKTEMSISKIHAELQIDSKQRYLLINKSRNGLYFKGKVKGKISWIKFEKSYVTLDTLLAFGNFQTTVRDILILVKNEKKAATQDSILYRDPRTGTLHYKAGD